MELNLMELMKLLMRKWWVVLIAVILCGGAAYAVTNYYMVPVYEASTTLFVGKDVNEAGVSVTDLNIGAAVVLDYREIAKSRLVASTVIERLGLEGITAKALSDSIEVVQRSETRIIEISVRHTDPRLAMDITNTVADVFREKIIDIMQVSNVSIIDRAEMPLSPASPKKMFNYTMGVFLGLVAGIGIVFLINYLDNTVKTPEDVKKHVNLPVIGTIPVFQIKRKGY